MGLCYVDVSPGNVAFDQETGEVRISDCDNVDVNGRGWRSATAGTESFMAPEIVQNTAHPDNRTDLWSLAVLLFWAFVRNHPLQGRREYEHQVLTKDIQLRLWGSEALFIFDPADRSNEAVVGHNVGALRYWPIYPEFLRQLFTEAFTRGLRDPRQRILESRWRRAMAQLRDAILPCAGCGRESFVDGDAAPQRCWHCSRPLPPHRRIVLPGYKIVAAVGGGVFAHHLDPRRIPEAGPPIARAIASPGGNDVVELENCGPQPWRACTPSGEHRDVPQGERVALLAGTRIAFGQAEADIV
jgi:hypothetical protein